MNRFIHPFEDRQLSVAEYKWLFDCDAYRFPNDMSTPARYKVLGNGNPWMPFAAVIDSVTETL